MIFWELLRKKLLKIDFVIYLNVLDLKEVVKF